MKIRRRSRRNRVIFVGMLLLVVFIITCFGGQFITKTGLFKVPGVVIYDVSLNDDEMATLKNIFTDNLVLDDDVKISAYDSLIKPELGQGEYLYKIDVPVTDFYDFRTDVNEFDEVATISLDELDLKKKLLSIDGKYFLDEYSEGAYFRVIKFDSNSFEKEIEPLVDATFRKDWPDSSDVSTFTQTGVTALARGMNEKLEDMGGDAAYFSKEIADFLKQFDITHTSNESSFSDSATSENICSDERFLGTLLDIGLDVVELTGNHNQDCGDDAAAKTIDLYTENNIKIVGGGKSAEEAAAPLNIDTKTNTITFLAYNLSTGGATLDDTPGANQYDEENASEEITAAKDRGDFVVVDIQYFECSEYVSESEDTTCDYANSSAGDQVGLFRHLIDLGADVVVGTSAHQPQTFEQYGDGAIYYGLGNLFFDQAWWPGTSRSLVLTHYLYKNKLLQTKITPTIYDTNYQTRLLDNDSAKQFLNRLINARPLY